MEGLDECLPFSSSRTVHSENIRVRSISFLRTAAIKVSRTISFLALCDAVITFSALAIEPIGPAKTFQQWFADTSPNSHKPRKVYVVGPMTPFVQNTSIGAESLPESREIEEFVERIYKSHGPQSMLYVGFVFIDCVCVTLTYGS